MSCSSIYQNWQCEYIGIFNEHEWLGKVVWNYKYEYFSDKYLDVSEKYCNHIHMSPISTQVAGLGNIAFHLCI